MGVVINSWYKGKIIIIESKNGFMFLNNEEKQYIHFVLNIRENVYLLVIVII